MAYIMVMKKKWTPSEAGLWASCERIAEGPAAVRRAKIEFADWFRCVCDERGLSLRDAGSELDLSHSYVSDLQNGRRAPSADVAKRVREWAVKETG